MIQKKKVLITFLGNLNYDTRCKNLFDTFSTNNYDVEFMGFDWMTKDFVDLNGNISVKKLNTAW